MTPPPCAMCWCVQCPMSSRVLMRWCWVVGWWCPVRATRLICLRVCANVGLLANSAAVPSSLLVGKTFCCQFGKHLPTLHLPDIRHWTDRPRLGLLVVVLLGQRGSGLETSGSKTSCWWASSSSSRSRGQHDVRCATHNECTKRPTHGCRSLACSDAQAK